MHARFTLAAAALLAAGTVVPALGQSQQNPNSQQILKSLTPTDNMSPSTRGIRIGTPQGGAPGQAQPAAQSQAQAPSANLTIEFASGSASLTPAAMRELDQLGRALADPKLAAYHFRVEGHTDTVGSRELNQTLSERRAATVVSYLAAKYSIPASRLEAVGKGEQDLLVQTPDQTAEPRNRRVLVVNVGS